MTEEIQITKKYLSIEEIRFGERLNVTFDLEPKALNWQVPSLILQPVVENCFKHGITNNTSFSIAINAHVSAGLMKIEVIDNGTGLTQGLSLENQDGIGLKNVRQRLKSIYGDCASFKLSNHEPYGVQAILTIPERS